MHPDGRQEDINPTPSTTPVHTLILNENWSLWRTFSVRGAGFPIGMLKPLAAAELEEAVENLLSAEEAQAFAITRATEICLDLLSDAEADDLRVLRRALRNLRKGRAPDVTGAPPEIAAPFRAALDAKEAVTNASETIATIAWPATDGRLQAFLRSSASNRKFREAVAWQNWPLLQNGFDSFLRQPREANNKNSRRRRALVTRYLQRYCAKNETIGFFGPMSWGKFVDEGAALTMHAGPALLSLREVHIEFWAIDELADALAGDPQCRPWLRPRLSPLARIEGNRLLGPYGNSSGLNKSQRQFLKACDGKTDARTIARLLAANPRSEFQTERQVIAQLDRLTESKIIVWRPDTPFGVNPEEGLRASLGSIKNKSVRERALAQLDKLTSSKHAVAEAAGEDEAVRGVLETLDRDFEAITGQAPQRHAGSAYAGRTLVYEDCRRDLDLTLGPGFLERLHPPLALVLESARWFLWRFAEQYREFLEAAFSEAQAKSGQTVLDLDVFWAFVQNQKNIVELMVADVAEQVTDKWAAILLVSEEAQQHTVTSLRAQVLESFKSPPPALWEAGQHSPDIMIAAESAQAVADGKYLTVLGEIHAGGNTLMHAASLRMHPCPETMLRAHKADNPARILRATANRKRPGQRLTYDPLTENDMHVEYDDSVSPRPRNAVLKAGSMVVERAGSNLIVRTRDGKHRFPALAFFGSQMRGQCARRFRLLASGPHTPRITVDNLVIQRESWQFPIDELTFAAGKTPLERYLGARRWARRNALPRWLFYRTPGELKPVYLDFQSPDLVELLAKFIRACPPEGKAQLSLSEMLPTPDQTWLADEEGNRYTSEIRVVAVDRSHASAVDALTA